jgi:hypothetical protein
MVRIHPEQSIAGAAFNLGPREAGNVSVQGVSRLEHHGRTARTSIGEEKALQNLVRPVGAEDLLRSDSMMGCDRHAKSDCIPVGVAVGVKIPDDLGKLGEELFRWALGRLVCIQPNVDFDLGGVVPSAKSDRRWAG